MAEFIGCRNRYTFSKRKFFKRRKNGSVLQNGAKYIRKILLPNQEDKVIPNKIV
jgi:hypothetical protein